MRKRNLSCQLVVILIIITLFTILSCDKSTKPKIEMEFDFLISNGAEWDEAISKIRSQGDGFSYTLSILNSFEMQNDESPTFGICKDITIELIGHDTPTISGNNWFLVHPHQFLRINDIILDNIFIRLENDVECTLYGKSSMINNEGMAIYISPGSKLFMKDNSSIKKASPINQVIYNYGEFYMEGNSSICDISGSGVINFYPAIFYMRGNATISNNASVGVWVGNLSSFFMEGNASVSNNGEWGISLADSTNFYMQDDTSIMNNGYGGVIALSSVNFIMKDNSTIRDNMGSAVQIIREGNFTMQDNALIDSNRGGVSIGYDVSFQMLGGKITNNFIHTDWSPSGSAVEIRGGTFVFAEGEISGNISEGPHDCGTIFLRSGSFLMNGGSIHGNINNTLYESSAVYLFDGSFVMSGGVIYGSEASGTPTNLANFSSSGKAALIDLWGGNSKYGDGTDILPHIEDDLWGTDYTIIGKE